MNRMNLHLINQKEFEKEFNQYPYFYEMFGKQTLQKLKQEVETIGAQDSIFINTSPSQYSVFELIHEHGPDVYYSFVIRVNQSRWAANLFLINQAARPAGNGPGAWKIHQLRI